MSEDIRQVPVSEELPRGWQQQAAARDRQEHEERILARDRLVASHCDQFRKNGRHNLVPDTTPSFFCGGDEGCAVPEIAHCDGRAPTVPGTPWVGVRCPVFVIDGDRYPPREGRIEPKARRKNIIRRRPA